MHLKKNGKCSEREEKRAAVANYGRQEKSPDQIANLFMFQVHPRDSKME